MDAPITFVIFGATGDLTQRKLVPALLDLYTQQLLPAVFRIVGFSRRSFDDAAFRSFLRSAIEQQKHGHDPAVVTQFLEHCVYHKGAFDDSASYGDLAESLITLDQTLWKTRSHTLFYLAVPPHLYETILPPLAHSGLTVAADDRWARVAIEKPFGSDSATAERLDKLLGLLFKEEQIFRIDHYLAKEAVQNLLTFRFSNALFEPIWNHQYIDRVYVRLHEREGVGSRGEFYDAVGALRDVGQNHLLQLLALIAMEHPGKLDPHAIRRERSRVLRSLRPIGKHNVATQVMRGQYEGYRAEAEVSSDSTTETFFRVTAYIDTKRWRSVPFILESGNKLRERKTEITLYFKKTESCLCPPDAEQHHEDVLTFRIQPDEGISVRFWAKQPGFGFHLESKELAFSYRAGEDARRLPDAYEYVLYDCIRGDQTLFTSTEEVIAAWDFTTPILQNWDALPLTLYAQGSDGPKKN